MVPGTLEAQGPQAPGPRPPSPAELCLPSQVSTPGARAAHTKVVQLTAQVIGETRRCKWSIIAGEAAFIVGKANAILQRQAPRVIAIGMNGELCALSNKLPGPPKDPERHHIFTIAQAMDFIGHISVCKTGVACVKNQ